MTLTPGARLGPFQIDGPLGAGGMGEVYRARDLRLDRTVAVKVLPERLARNPDALARFEREARAVAALSHPNLLAVHEIVEEESGVYFVTESLEGETLRARLGRGKLPWREAAEVARDVADGLAAAHTMGIIHWDLRPENIFLTADGRVKVIDFGLTHALATGAEATTLADAYGSVLGPLGYMSPEQFRDAGEGPATDVFSLACVLYEAVTGKRPFAKPVPAETMAAVLHEDPLEASFYVPDLPLGLDELLRGSLRKDPREAPRTASEVAQALSDLLAAPKGPHAAVASMSRGIERAGPVRAAHPRWLPQAMIVAGTLAVVYLLRFERVSTPSIPISIGSLLVLALGGLLLFGATKVSGDLLAVGATARAVSRVAAKASRALLPRSLDDEAPEPSGYDRVRVFYATDRKPTGKVAVKRYYSGEFSDGGRLEYGWCSVSLPWQRRIGELQAPSVLRLDFEERADKHVSILFHSTYASADAFFQGLRDRVAWATEKELLVFIHGYRVTFAEAVKRAAQIAYDLHFTGAPVLYSWPSRGSWWRYTWDEDAVLWTTPHLRDFLKRVAAESGATSIHLIGHSMGNRALAQALAELSREPIRQRFRQIILAAADINARVFQQLAAEFRGTAERVTGYASWKDWALLLSYLFHWHARAGQAAHRMVAEGVDAIEASAVDTSLLGHSYYGSNKSVLSDLFCLLQHDSPPTDRFGLSRQRRKGKEHWIFEP